MPFRQIEKEAAMIIKRILSWSILMALCSVVTAQAARAEQPIIIPIVLVVCQNSGQGNTMGRPIVQTAVYKSQEVGRQTYATVPELSAYTRKVLIEASRANPDSWKVQRVEFRRLEHARSTGSGRTEISVPMVLKLVIGGEVATHVSVYPSTDRPRDRWTEAQGPVVPATDLLTGKPTAVRPEYVKEYQQIVRSEKNNAD